MKIKNVLVYFVGLALALSPAFAMAETALTTSCVGAPATTNILWTASSNGGVAPIAFLWGNSSTSTVQSIAVSPGTYSMTIQATDASSTVATSTCSATVAQPTTTGTDYKTQIQNLLNQIAVLKAQLADILKQQVGSTGNSGTTPPGQIGLCLKHDKDLSRGERGEEVRELQKHLNLEDSSIFGADNITGFFGPKTEDALKKYQRKHGIFVMGSTTTGFFGPMTRGFIRGHCGDRKDKNASTTPQFKVNNRGGNDDGDDDRGNNRNGRDD